jgi:LPS sulfotransferase NodH
MIAPISAYLRSARASLARGALELRCMAGTTNYRRFVIVGIARTGSTMLISMLNTHRQALVFGEIFRRPDVIGWDVQPYSNFTTEKLLALYRSDPCAFMDKAVFRRWPRDRRAVGFKIFYYHARTAPHSTIWNYLARNTDILVIHIKRRNILAQYFSLQLAHMTDVWAITQPSRPETQPIRLEAEACRKHFEWVRSLELEADSFFAKHRMLGMEYESLVADQVRELSRVQSFLGLEEQRLCVKTQRQRTTPLSWGIANFDELEREFRGTEWAEFFTDTGE